MKINIKNIVVVGIALFLAACSKESVENQDSHDLITFNVPSSQWNMTTRAKVLSSMADLQNSNTDVRVTAKYHSDNSTVYFEKERLTYASDEWVIKDYYWIPDVHLDFFAEVVSGNFNQFPSHITDAAVTSHTFQYTVPTAIANQHDYVYAVSFDKYREDVPLDFRHALSQIVFTASVTENWKVTIQSITIKNVCSAGTFSYDTGLWTDLDTQDKSYVFTLASATTFIGQTQPVELLASSSEPSERLVLMPQTLNPWQPKVGNSRVPITTADANKLSYVIISCKIQDLNDSNYIVGNASSYGLVYAPLAGTWEPNKKYIYNLPFGAGYKDTGNKTIEQITLSATIVDWTTGNTESGQGKFD